jgi:hypothetical protein
LVKRVHLINSLYLSSSPIVIAIASFSWIHLFIISQITITKSNFFQIHLIKFKYWDYLQIYLGYTKYKLFQNQFTKMFYIKFTLTQIVLLHNNQKNKVPSKSSLHFKNPLINAVIFIKSINILSTIRLYS